MAFNFGVEERRIILGSMSTRYLPKSMQIKIATQKIRRIVDDLARNILKAYPSNMESLKTAIQKSQSDEVKKCEENFVRLFTVDYNSLDEMNTAAKYLEATISLRIATAIKVLEHLRSKAVLKEVEPQIAEFSNQLQGLRTAQKELWERVGGLVQSQEFKYMNLQGQMDAMRSLLTPMVLDGRVERKLSFDVIGFCDNLAKIAWDLRKSEQDPKRMQEGIKELRKNLEDFNRYFPDDYTAIVSLRVNATFLFRTLDMQVMHNVEALRNLLPGGFPPKTEKGLEEKYNKLVDGVKVMKQQMMWDEQFEDRTVEDAVNLVTRLQDEIRTASRRA